MKRCLLKIDDTDRIIAGNARFATSFFDRMRGMIGRSFAKTPFDAMVFENCNAIHCCWMTESIDVIFVDEKWEVIKLCSKVKPWYFASGGRRSRTTIELPAGKIKSCGLKTGDRLKWADSSDERI